MSYPFNFVPILSIQPPRQHLYIYGQLPPRKIIVWNPKMEVWKMIFQPAESGGIVYGLDCHVKVLMLQPEGPLPLVRVHQNAL